MAKPKQFWVVKKDGPATGVHIARWVPGSGMVITEDPRTPQQIEASACDRGHEVHYCAGSIGIGTKTLEAICKVLGYDWEAFRVTVHD